MKSRLVFNDDQFLQRKMNGEYIIFNLKTEHYYTLDGVGNLIFGLLLEGKIIQEIERSISNAYKMVDEQTLKQDIRDFIRQLSTKNMIFPA